jgi:hypothetical protein
MWLAILLLVTGLIVALVQARNAESQLKRSLRKCEALAEEEQSKLKQSLSSCEALAQKEKFQLKQSLKKYETLVNKEEYQQQLESNIHKLVEQKKFFDTEIKNLQQQFNELDAKVYLQSIDYYEPKYEFVSSEDYIFMLKDIKVQQNDMRKNNQAYICDTEWTVGDSKREGKKMVNNLLKLVENAFEGQCKYAVKEVKFNNVESLKKKINSEFEKYNKCLQSLQCKISEEYLKIKLIELDLQYELEDKKQQEREEEKEIRKQSKEREAIEKARQKAEEAEERENIHQQELERVRQEVQQIEQVQSDKRKQLELKIQELERQVAEDRSDKENALSESRRLKSGYIYIVSNIGSLGRDIYRICITYRSREDEYIRDMNPVVPFQFDVHFKIFSEDALDTLQRLHQRFDDKRVNIVNSRRDFFKVSIDEIEQAVKQIKKETGVLRIDVFETAPQAYEYRQTVAARKKLQPNLNNQFLQVDESA